MHMDKIDISLKTTSGRFNYRVGAIIIHDSKLLMVKNANMPYYYTVGGRVKFNETSSEAVIREVLEETQIHFKIDRLAFVHENFFIWEHNDEPFHEIAFYYIMKPTANINMICDSYGEDGGKETLHWLPVDKLNDYFVYPEFLQTRLINMNNHAEHFVTRDMGIYK